MFYSNNSTQAFEYNLLEDLLMKRIIVLSAIGFLAACSNNAIKTNTASPVSTPVNEAAKQSVAPEATPSSVNQSAMMVNPLTDPNSILSKRSVYFDFDKYNIKPEFKPLIEAHAKYLTTHPEASCKLEGNADERGSREYNLALGQKRAVSVKSALKVVGVVDQQLETISYGKEKPIADGHNEQAWSQNRRTDIKYQGE